MTWSGALDEKWAPIHDVDALRLEALKVSQCRHRDLSWRHGPRARAPPLPSDPGDQTVKPSTPSASSQLRAHLDPG